MGKKGALRHANFSRLAGGRGSIGIEDSEKPEDN